MQSILQYRMFKTRARKQVEQHGVSKIGRVGRSGQLPLDKPSSDCNTNNSGNTGVQTPYEEGLELQRVLTRDTSDMQLARSLAGVRIVNDDQSDGETNVLGAPKPAFVVGYVDPTDPLNPHNWSWLKRISATLLVSFISLTVGLASSIDSTVITPAGNEFGVGEVAESLATGLFLVGWAIGSLFTTPLGETIGRNPVYVITMMLFMLFIMASAIAPNIGAQLVFRFLAGVFGSAPSTTSGGSISDMWTPLERTFAFPIFAQFSFWGPILGPVVGGFIGQAAENGTISWRWAEWTTLIFSGLILILVVLFLPETYTPRLLEWKALHLRQLTGDDRYISPRALQQTKFVDRLVHNIYRPFVVASTEPIVILFTLYMSVVYVVLYTFLTGYGFIFADIFGLNNGLTFLCFLGLGIGFLLNIPMIPWVNIRYHRRLATLSEIEKSVEPEQRLIYLLVGAPLLPVGLFWMAWTAYSSFTLWPPLVATVPIGFAIMTVYVSSYQYLIDAFDAEAANALVAATVVRYAASGGMIAGSIPIYRGIGVHWTLTLLAIISLLLTPIPFIFYRYGAAIRKRSRSATKH